mmetsp:Transcript_18609/g.39109  ORF Transcript_18609/g.39109 Transcript_18609/m.39109 type:complete len:180 (-) Transcript_18609:114-653(-)
MLKAGDRVRSAPGEFSEVFFFGHRDPESWHTFVRITTIRGSVLALSEEHLLYIQDSVARVLVPARNVITGMEVVEFSGKASRIDRIERVMMQGLFNPHTYSGTIMVNGILASCFNTVVPPGVGQALLAPERLLYRMGSRLLGGWFDTNTPSCVQRVGSAVRLVGEKIWTSDKRSNPLLD